jgi:hypothetical protein
MPDPEKWEIRLLPRDLARESPRRIGVNDHHGDGNRQGSDRLDMLHVVTGEVANGDTPSTDG